ncbi:D-glucuronyl C5-epimerase family protein [Agrococcus casei]|uniref:D-glucuronyl C5-epimerase family protein n=1 Tax=Agrococcus casei TaxID=343512 RepID=UPI003F92D90D
MSRFTFASLPPLPEARQRIYNFYRLVLDEDGVPCRRMDDESIVFHPILGAYVLVDFLKVYEASGDERAIVYAEHLASALASRGDPDFSELVFTYRESDGLSSVPGTFYSALTQAWYVKAYALLSAHRPGKYDESLRRVWQSLLRPLSDNGVLVKKSYGWIVEEYPHHPAFYTLNGWLTVIRWVIQSAEQLREAGIDVNEFVERNVDAVERLLPLYDAKFVWNSRYQLTGFTRLRMTSGSGTSLKCKSLTLHIPGEGEVEADMESESSNRWTTRLERTTERRAQFNIVQSLISHPEPNSVAVEIAASTATSVTVEIADGSYRPDATGLPTTGWREIATLQVPEGSSHQAIDIPFDGTDLFAYPTNFKKVIDGTWYNGYHFVHVIDLAEIYRFSPRPLLREFTIKWLEYIDHWPDMDALQDPKYSYESHVYGDKLERLVYKLLGESRS